MGDLFRSQKKQNNKGTAVSSPCTYFSYWPAWIIFKVINKRTLRPVKIKSLEPLVTSSLSSDEKLGTPVDFETPDKEINIRGGVTGWNMICTFCQPKWRMADYVRFRARNNTFWRVCWGESTLSTFKLKKKLFNRGSVKYFFLETTFSWNHHSVAFWEVMDVVWLAFLWSIRHGYSRGRNAA